MNNNCNKPKPPKGLENYPGSKWANGVYQTIINQMPPHDIYIEPFLGSGAIFLNKRLAGITYGNDIDQKVIAKWELQDPSHIILSVGCAMDLLKHWTPGITNVLVYIDAPYLLSSRRNGKAIYKYEMNNLLHRKLVTRAVTWQFNCIISSYRNEMYDQVLKDWRSIDFITGTHKGAATETLYMNYPEPKELHDYRYLGKDCHDRQRIRTKINRRVETLNNLPILERNAILNSLNENLQ